MKVLDPGHRYLLKSLDGWQPHRMLQFVKRCDPEHPERYPGNVDAYPGATLQDVLRACLERTRYLQRQIWCLENLGILAGLKLGVWLLEFRAARRRGYLYLHGPKFAETSPMCPQGGHTDCRKHGMDEVWS